MHKNTHKCPKCKSLFKDLSDHNCTLKKCDLCEYYFDQETLEIHKNIHKLKKKCNFCEKYFEDEKIYEIHKNSHKCLKCKGFFSKIEMHKHNCATNQRAFKYINDL